MTYTLDLRFFFLTSASCRHVCMCGFLGWTDLRAKGFCLVAFSTASFGVPHRRKTPPLAALE